MNSQLSIEFTNEIINRYKIAIKDLGYTGSRLIYLISTIGGVKAAKKIIKVESLNEGFEKLWESRRLDLTVESVVIKDKYSTLFTKEEINSCVEKLKTLGYPVLNEDKKDKLYILRILKELEMKKITNVFNQIEIKEMESRSKMTRIFAEKINEMCGTHSLKVRLCLVSENHIPFEVIALSQFKHDFDEHIYESNLYNTELYNNIENSVIIFIKKTGRIENYEILNSIHLSENCDELYELKKDYYNICEEIKKNLSTGRKLSSVKGGYLVCKPKDSKPYKPIYSDIFSREVSDKNYGWYFRKKWLSMKVISKKESVIEVEGILEMENESVVNEDFKVTNLMDIDFYKFISNLKTSSKEAIASPNVDNSYSAYLHVDRQIEEDFFEITNSAYSDNQKKLIFLIGNSGDGKSRLLQELKRRDILIYNAFNVHNDATESHYLNKDSVHTLVDILEPFSDKKFEDGKEKLIVAINMGIIGKFIDSEYSEDFTILKNFFEKSNALQENQVKKKKENYEVVEYLSFSEYNAYSVTNEGGDFTFVKSFFDKVFVNDKSNMFFSAFKEVPINIAESCPVCFNYREFCKPEISAYIIKLLIYIHLEDKIMLTPRIIWNYIYELLLGAEVEQFYTDISRGQFDYRLYIKNLYYNKLMSVDSLNPLIQGMRKNSNSIEDNFFNDVLLNKIMLVSDHPEEFIKLVNTELKSKSNMFDKSVLKAITGKPEDIALATISIIRHQSFNRIQECYKEEIEKLNKYSKLLYEYNFVKSKNKKKELKELRGILTDIIKYWNGNHYRKDLIYSSFEVERIKKSTKFNCNIAHKEQNDLVSKYVFSPVVIFVAKTFNQEHELVIDFNLYSILLKLHNGYQLSANERLDNVRLNSFIELIIESNINDLEQYITTNNNETYLLEYNNDYEQFEFSKE